MKRCVTAVGLLVVLALLALPSPAMASSSSGTFQFTKGNAVAGADIVSGGFKWKTKRVAKIWVRVRGLRGGTTVRFSFPGYRTDDFRVTVSRRHGHLRAISERRKVVYEDDYIGHWKRHAYAVHPVWKRRAGKVGITVPAAFGLGRDLGYFLEGPYVWTTLHRHHDRVSLWPMGGSV